MAHHTYNFLDRSGSTALPFHPDPITVVPTFQPPEFAQAASSKASLRDRPQVRHAKIPHSLDSGASINNQACGSSRRGCEIRMPRMNMARVESRESRVETPPRRAQRGHVRAASRASVTAQCVSKTWIDPNASSPHSK
ncbi:hypothetical protein E4U50_004928 [Claviceps purpurea]|nr:hypothetical protein E4U50_004928 [Claviceps purpurea]